MPNGLEKNFLNIANDDVLGRKLQDAEIVVRKPAPKVKKKPKRKKYFRLYQLARTRKSDFDGYAFDYTNEEKKDF